MIVFCNIAQITDFSKPYDIISALTFGSVNVQDFQ